MQINKRWNTINGSEDGKDPLGSCSQKTETSSLASDWSSITYYTLYCKSKFPRFPNFLFHSNTSFFKKTKKKRTHSLETDTPI